MANHLCVSLALKAPCWGDSCNLMAFHTQMHLLRTGKFLFCTMEQSLQIHEDTLSHYFWTYFISMGMAGFVLGTRY